MKTLLNRNGWLIFTIAALALFAEMALIRVHASYFQLFAYFKNASLLSCFLGLGIGYAQAQTRPDRINFFFPLLSLQVIALSILRHHHLPDFWQNPVPELFSFGMNNVENFTEAMQVYALVFTVYIFNALCFIPLGRLTGAMMKREPKLQAYGWNLAGSLFGVLLFTVFSYLWTPPLIWMVVIAVALPLLGANKYITLLFCLSLMLFTGKTATSDSAEIYSPYQILHIDFKQPHAELRVNNVYYQRILDVKQLAARDDTIEWGKYYHLPYLFHKSVHQGPDVLVVGSGTGNDVAAALNAGARSVDAVEIDPAILKIGAEMHPNKPYQSDKVQVFIDDARSYFKTTSKKYDMIVYGLLDSHSLLSSKASVRLDSYVYTVEAFKEARKHLSEDGILSLSFCLIEKTLGRKLFIMLTEAFDGAQPLVYKSKYDSSYTFIAGAPSDTSAIPSQIRKTNEFHDHSIITDAATDDWPFFYMPVRKYPLSYAVMIAGLCIVSLVFVSASAPSVSGWFSLPCFFLGAAFMLVETKAITELALLFGSTWLVSAIAVSAVLLMSFCANFVTARHGDASYKTYAALLLSLVAGFIWTTDMAGSGGITIARIASIILLTLPIFFAGRIFSSQLNLTQSVSGALSSNLLGAMLGGFLEYNSMYFGFKSLYLLAILLYILAFLAIKKKMAAPYGLEP